VTWKSHIYASCKSFCCSCLDACLSVLLLCCCCTHSRQCTRCTCSAARAWLVTCRYVCCCPMTCSTLVLFKQGHPLLLLSIQTSSSRICQYCHFCSPGCSNFLQETRAGYCWPVLPESHCAVAGCRSGCYCHHSCLSSHNSSSLADLAVVAAVARDCQPGRLPRSQTAASHLMMTQLTRRSCNTGGARSLCQQCADVMNLISTMESTCW